MRHPQIILASQSEARKRLLKRLGFPFKAVVSNVDESEFQKRILDPRLLVRTLALEKALSVQSHDRYKDSVVIGSDQVVVFNGTIYGKPGTQSRAEKQLATFSGNTIEILTAVCVLIPGVGAKRFIDTTQMGFRKLNAKEIKAYVALDNPVLCAGSFKFEQSGITLFEFVKTKDPTAIEGLPLMRLRMCLSAHVFLNGSSI
jgi:septum formation protein